MKRAAYPGIAVLMLIIAMAAAGCVIGGASTGTGTLTGTVTVGPLAPPNVTPTIPDPSLFTSKKVLLYDATGKTLLEEMPVRTSGPNDTYGFRPKHGSFELEPDYTGLYSIELAPGTYRIGWEDYLGSCKLPPFDIEAGKNTDIDVFMYTELIDTYPVPGPIVVDVDAPQG